MAARKMISPSGWAIGTIVLMLGVHATTSSSRSTTGMSNFYSARMVWTPHNDNINFRLDDLHAEAGKWLFQMAERKMNGSKGKGRRARRDACRGCTEPVTFERHHLLWSPWAENGWFSYQK